MIERRGFLMSIIALLVGWRPITLRCEYTDRHALIADIIRNKRKWPTAMDARVRAEHAALSGHYQYTPEQIRQMTPSQVRLLNRAIRHGLARS